MFLTDLVFLGNPVEEEASEDGTYTAKVRNIFTMVHVSKLKMYITGDKYSAGFDKVGWKSCNQR